MLPLRLMLLPWLGLCAATLGVSFDASPAHAGAGRGGGAGRAHFAPPSIPQFSAPRVSSQFSAPRLGFQIPRALPALGIPPSRWGRPVSAPSALRSYPVASPLHFRVPVERNFRSATTVTGSLRPIRVWPGNASTFARHQLSAAPIAGLHQHLQNRLQGPGFQPRFGFFAAHHHRHLRSPGFAWSGPVFWPDAYWDLLDDTFDAYSYDAFWPWAYPDIYSAGDHAGTAYAAVRAKAPSRHDAAYEPCGVAALTAWPVEQIAQALNIDDAQRAELLALEHVAGQAVDLFNAWCTQKIPGTPVERMREVHARLSAVLRGLEMMRPVLARFYGSLSQTQKAQLDAFACAEPEETEQSHAAAVACGGQAPRAPALPVGRIERELQTNVMQRAALRDFESAILQARDTLQMRCRSEERSTLAGRFEQTWTRLNSLLRAFELVEPALATFYGLLEDEQKTRFNRIAQRRE
jgi:hypothetical protein